MTGRVLIYGGKGALGSVVVQFFKSKNFVSSFSDEIPFGNSGHIPRDEKILGQLKTSLIAPVNVSIRFFLHFQVGWQHRSG